MRQPWIGIQDGRLSLDDHVLKFFPAAAPERPSENLKGMKVRDLLTMSGSTTPNRKR